MTTMVAPEYIAFLGTTRIGAGSVADVARAAKASADGAPTEPLLIFHARTSQPLELDLRGSLDDVLARLPLQPPEAAGLESAPTHEPGGPADAPPTRAGPGRPKLGVVAREITLLPRHWQWLAEQPGGASVTLRRLVESARSAGATRDRRRVAQESAYRFLSAMLGNASGYEEAIRALFANDPIKFAAHTAPWPVDLRAHAHTLADAAFTP